MFAVFFVGGLIVGLVLFFFSRKGAKVAVRSSSVVSPKEVKNGSSAVAAHAPSGFASFETIKGKKAIVAAFADEQHIITCTTDHVVRLFEDGKCVAQLAVPSAPTYDFLALSGAAIFAFEGFESTVHVFGIVRHKNGETELRAASKISVTPPSAKQIVKSMTVARCKGGTLVGFFFGSGVCQLYDAKLGKLVHTIANEKFRTNGLALIGFDNHVLALLATFDPSLSVLKCVLDAGGSWQFERAAQIKTMQSEELMDVVGNTGGVVVRSKDGKSHAWSAAEQFTLTRWKGPFEADGKCKISPCGRFCCTLQGAKLCFVNKQLQTLPLLFPWSASNFWFAGSQSVVLTIAGDPNVHRIKNPFSS